MFWITRSLPFDLRHCAFDRGLDLDHDLVRAAPGGFDRLADHDADFARPLQERVTRPEFAGIVCHRHRRNACGNGEQGAAGVVRVQAQQGRVRQVEVDDEGTVTDIDTVQDLERAAKLLAARG